LGEGVDGLFAAIVVDLEVCGFEVGDGVTFFVEGYDGDFDEACCGAEAIAGVGCGGS
jgi:hypothetical protein